MEEAERLHAYLAGKAKGRGLEPQKQFKVSPTVKMGAQYKDVADTRWVVTRREVEGAKTVKARLAAEGSQGPDLRKSNVDIAGCVS